MDAGQLAGRLLLGGRPLPAGHLRGPVPHELAAPVRDVLGPALVERVPGPFQHHGGHEDPARVRPHSVRRGDLQLGLRAQV